MSRHLETQESWRRRGRGNHGRAENPWKAGTRQLATSPLEALYVLQECAGLQRKSFSLLHELQELLVAQPNTYAAECVGRGRHRQLREVCGKSLGNRGQDLRGWITLPRFDLLDVNRREWHSVRELFLAPPTGVPQPFDVSADALLDRRVVAHASQHYFSSALIWTSNQGYPYTIEFGILAASGARVSIGPCCLSVADRIVLGASLLTRL